MRRWPGNIFLILILMISAAIPVTAWDDVGHKITAYIAWQRMSPAARENVIKILRSAPEDSQLATFYMSYGAEPEETRKREYFMIVSIWADIVRDRSFDTRFKKYHNGNWHYSDTFWKQVNGKVEVLSGLPEGGLGVEKLVEFDKVLRDSVASNKDKAIAIAWIMHIGGDLHQPLHTSARVTDLEPKGDQGGNLFLLSPQGTKRQDQVTLHSFWDSITGRSFPIKGEQCERDYIEPIADRIIKKYPFAKMQTQLQLGQYGAWQKESFALNSTDVFSDDLKRNEMPSEKYKKHAFEVSERQFALAGYRLGETLNAIFGSATVSPVANAAKCQVIRKIIYPIYKKQISENITKAKSAIAVLNICPSGPTARPTTMVEANGRKISRAFDVAKIFESEDEARKYASSHAITDIKFEIQ